MNLLAIETSTHIASIALYHEGTFFYEENSAQKKHAQSLLPLIEKMLKKAHLSFQELDGIVYGRGPGSFTGLRIAISVAKGIGFGLQIPLFPVSTLAAIAYKIRNSANKYADARILSLIDARMHQLYWAYFCPGEWDAKEGLSDPNQIQLPSNEPIVIAGVDFEAYLEKLPQSLQSSVLHTEIAYPEAKAMIQLVLNNQIQPVDATNALPVYLRNQVTQGDNRG